MMYKFIYFCCKPQFEKLLKKLNWLKQPPNPTLNRVSVFSSHDYLTPLLEISASYYHLASLFQILSIER
jgi:hypothetical protein